MGNCSQYILKEMYTLRVEALNDLSEFMRLVICSEGSKS